MKRQWYFPKGSIRTEEYYVRRSDLDTAGKITMALSLFMIHLTTLTAILCLARRMQELKPLATEHYNELHTWTR